MGMTENQLGLIRAVAEKNRDNMRKYAIACCTEDTTKKNRPYVKRYQSLLENGGPELMPLPFNIKGMAALEDVSGFREDRYYLTDRERSLFQQISSMADAGLKLMEMGIPYLNAVLLTGQSGTGKTTFARYVAYKLELPYLYINFSYLIDSYMGKTGQNLRNVFDYAKGNRCLLMLDELDAIAMQRKGADTGASREYNNCTITLLQELDQIQNDSLVIGATNIPEHLDKAVIRRFPMVHEVKKLTENETFELIGQYLDTTGLDYSIADATDFAAHMVDVPQAVLLNTMIQRIADAIIHKSETVNLKCEV